MQTIKTLDALAAHLSQQEQRYRLAVVCGTDPCNVKAVMRAVEGGFVSAVFIGDENEARTHRELTEREGRGVSFVHCADPAEASRRAVEMVREGEADFLMKGLIHTDVLLRAVLNKETGILPRGNVLTHIAMAQMPAYSKLLFFTDAAVIPYPTHEQRTQQVAYLAQMLHSFGVDQPRIALVHCTEEPSPKFPHTEGYAEIVRRAQKGEWGNVIVDGPLDLRTACDPVALHTKGINSPLEGEADAVVLPDIESGNLLYKALPLFAHATLAGTLMGTSAPVVLSSRGDDADSKFYSLALAAMGIKTDQEKHKKETLK